MPLEVEQKFRITDPAEVRARLADQGIELAEPQYQIDTYFAHPVRDFAATDEALRIRRLGESTYIAYKGPKLDQTTKTRREIELPIAPGAQAAESLQQLLLALGFSPVAKVHKYRRRGGIQWQGHAVEIAWDEVQQLGTFLELEIMADEAGLQPAQAALASLAARLQLAGGERRSYLEMLLTG
jgi:adenylate cyclase class 2